MFQAAPSDRELAGVLDRQIDAMQAVLAALEAERAALGARDSEALLQAVNCKASRVSEAGALEAQRRALYAAPLRPQFSADAGVTHRWQQLIALTERCRSLNESNGQLIRGQRRRVDHTLCILRGESAAVPAEYGPKGDTRSRHAARSLGSV
jgi:flagellar biosynthesis protein FlgN